MRRHTFPFLRRPVHVAVLGAVMILVTVLVRPVSAQQSKMQILGGGRYMTESVRQVAANGLTTLRITGPHNLGGEIVVSTGRVDSVQVKVARILKVESIDAARAFAREVRVQLNPDGRVLHVDIRTRPEAPWEGTRWSASCDLDITIPREWELEIGAANYDYDLDGPFRSATITSEYGQLKLSNVLERTEIQGSHTSMELSNLRGWISAGTNYSDLIAHRVIPSPEQAARFTNSYGKIVIDELAGTVSVDADNSTIVLRDAVLVGATSRLTGKNYPIEARILEFSDAQLEIQNSGANVTLEVPQELSARLNCIVGTGGAIRTSNLEVVTLARPLRQGRIEGVCGSGRGVVDIEIFGAGLIDVRGG